MGKEKHSNAHADGTNGPPVARPFLETDEILFRGDFRRSSFP